MRAKRNLRLEALEVRKVFTTLPGVENWQIHEETWLVEEHIAANTEDQGGGGDSDLDNHRHHQAISNVKDDQSVSRRNLRAVQADQVMAQLGRVAGGVEGNAFTFGNGGLESILALADDPIDIIVN